MNAAGTTERAGRLKFFGTDSPLERLTLQDLIEHHAHTQSTTMTIHRTQLAHDSAKPWCAYSLPASLEAMGLAFGERGQTSMFATVKEIFVGNGHISLDRSGRPPGALT